MTVTGGRFGFIVGSIYRMFCFSIRLSVAFLVLFCWVAGQRSVASAQDQRLQDQLSAESVTQLASDAEKFGDPVRGALAFYQPTMNCAKCHEQGDRGRRLGPDLTERRTVETGHLITSLLDPSAKIHDDYQTALVELVDGQVLTGVLVEETDDRVVIDQIEQADGPLEISKDEIEQWRRSKTSSMPEQLANQLVDRGQFVDLVSYLRAIADGGPARAASLKPAGSMAQVPLPEYEARIDHAGLIRSLNSDALARGADTYRLHCASCHGTVGEEGSMPTSLRFATGRFKHGHDPLTMYQTLTHGYGMMNPQRWMVPQQKHEVIHYIREHFLKEHNPDQYFQVTPEYVAGLPKGDTRGPKPEVRQPWSEMNYGPSMNNTIEVSQDGSNIAQKGVAIRLDDGPGGVESGSYWLLYDHDTMRVAAAWSGDFIDYNGIHFNGVHGRHPKITGDVHFSNPQGPGYGHPADGRFVDERLVGRDDRRFGPLARDWAHYKGMYRFGERTILEYTVGKTRILESPGLEFVDGQAVFTRTLNLGPRSEDLVLQFARVPDANFRLLTDSPATALVGTVIPEQSEPQSADKVLFDGTTFLQNDKSLDMSRDFTITARIKTTKGGTIFCQTLDQPDWLADGQTFFVRDGRLVFDIGWVGAVTGQARVSDGKWHDVAVSWSADNEEFRFYVDGKQDGKPRELAVKKPLKKAINRIGFTNENFPDPSFFQGEIESVRFYQAVVEPDAIRNAPEKQLVGAWLNGEPQVFGNLANRQLEFERRSAGQAAAGPAQGLVANLSPASAGQWEWADGQDLRLRIPAGKQPLRITLRAAEESSGPSAALLGAFKKGPSPVDLVQMTRGGPRNWPETLQTDWLPGEETGPFAVDVLKRPTENPWADRLRLTGIDFMKDGQEAIISSWDGSIWRVRGIQDGSDGERAPVTWQRMAAGLFQPLGVKIVNDEIFVTCRDQLVRLHDLNGDGEADWYESFNSDHQVTEHFHEFAMGLQVDKEGNFYYAKSARHALPALVPHHGTLLKVSKDGSTTEIIANGFRAANGVCINPDGTFIVTDQEGHWNPKNRINWVTPGGFYGNMYGYHDVEDSSDEMMDDPLCWITNAFDRSPSELLWVPNDCWGPLGGSLLNFSYGYGQIHVVPHESIDGQMQGGMCAFPLPRFPTGVMRGRFHDDQHLYCCGMFAWAGDQHQPGGMYRVRYTGQPAHLPVGLRATKQGLEITLSEPVDRASAMDVENYAIQTWDLKRTKNYGSQHYNEQRLEISRAVLSEDGRTILLTVPDIQPTWGMEVVYSLKGIGGESVRGKIHNTIHQLGESP